MSGRKFLFSGLFGYWIVLKRRFRFDAARGFVRVLNREGFLLFFGGELFFGEGGVGRFLIQLGDQLFEVDLRRVGIFLSRRLRGIVIRCRETDVDRLFSRRILPFDHQFFIRSPRLSDFDGQGFESQFLLPGEADDVLDVFDTFDIPDLFLLRQGLFGLA